MLPLKRFCNQHKIVANIIIGAEMTEHKLVFKKYVADISRVQAEPDLILPTNSTIKNGKDSNIYSKVLQQK